MTTIQSSALGSAPWLVSCYGVRGLGPKFSFFTFYCRTKSNVLINQLYSFREAFLLAELGCLESAVLRQPIIFRVVLISFIFSQKC